MTKILKEQRKSEKDENQNENVLRDDIEGFIESLEISRGNDCESRGWSIMPNELLLKIFHFLSPEDLTKASQVCYLLLNNYKSFIKILNDIFLFFLIPFPMSSKNVSSLENGIYISLSRGKLLNSGTERWSLVKT